MTNTTTLYMPFYFEWADILDHLSDAEYGRLVKAILAFASGKGYEPKLSAEAKLAYRFIISAISRSEAKRYGGGLESCGTSDSGTVRGKNSAPRREKKVFKRIDRTKADEENGKDEKVDASPTNDEKTLEKEKTSYTNANKFKETEDEFPTNAQKSAPSIDEVRGFFKSRNFISNPDEFFNFYESNGWMVGQNPMRNWYSSAENWEIKAQRGDNRGGFGTGSARLENSDTESRRYGDFDVHEAFRLALERSYADADDEEE